MPKRPNATYLVRPFFFFIMRPPAPAHPIELDQDPRIESLTWTAERCGWVAMAALILAALCGLFGGGPLSRVVGGDPRGAVEIEYERFGRLGRPMGLDVRGTALAREGGELTISLPEACAQSFDVEIRTASVERVLLREARRVYALRIEASAATAWTIQLRLKPRRAGLIAGDVVVAGGAPIPVSHVIYP